MDWSISLENGRVVLRDYQTKAIVASADNIAAIGEQVQILATDALARALSASPQFKEIQNHR